MGIQKINETKSSFFEKTNKFDKVGVLALPNSETKIVWNGYKDRHISQWKRSEGLEMNSSIYGQVIFYCGIRTIQQERDNLFSKWCWEDWIHI